MLKSLELFDSVFILKDVEIPFLIKVFKKSRRRIATRFAVYDDWRPFVIAQSIY